MSINRRTVAVGLAALGLVGLGGGIAWAADASTPSTSDSTASHCAGGYGMLGATRAPMNAAADYLGLDRAELIDQMQSGKSLADIAQAQGKTTAGLKVAMVTAMKQSLAADTDLTAAQRSAMLAMMTSHVDVMLTGSHMFGMGADGMGADGMGADGMGADGMGADDMGADDMGADDMGADDMGADDMGGMMGGSGMMGR